MINNCYRCRHCSLADHVCKLNEFEVSRRMTCEEFKLNEGSNENQ